MVIEHVSKIFHDAEKGNYNTDFVVGKGSARRKINLVIAITKNDVKGWWSSPSETPEKRQTEIERSARMVKVIEESDKEPIQDEKDLCLGPEYWYFKKNLYRIKDFAINDKEEMKMRLKHFAYQREKGMEKISREVEAFENQEKVPAAQRERIPGTVRLFVWQRDGGKCVNCGSQEKLEYDHIIPVIEGGSNTERNIQLLCENCNRSKGRNIG